MSLTSSLFDAALTIEERFSKARIRLRKAQPFFSYIVERLRVKRDDSIGTIGITKNGNCMYNEEFIKKLTDDQLIGVLVHEVMHCALRHFHRQMERKATCNGIFIWNWAGDAQINQMITDNGLELPPEGIIPMNDMVSFGPVVVEDVSQKSTEELYDEIVAQLKKMLKKGEATENSGEEGISISIPDEVQDNFDKHLDDSDSDDGSSNDGDSDGKSKDKSKGDASETEESDPSDKGDGSDSDGESSDDVTGCYPVQSSEEPSGTPVDWSEVLAKAHAHAKLAGKEPAGFDRMFADLHKPKICWRAILRRTVASAIPEDFTWSRPHKKYVAHDIFLPSPYGETIKVVCAIDTSGSIDQETLTDFISEMVGISKAYHEAEFIVLSHDIDVHDEIPITNGYRKKLAEMELHGGGGTSHVPVFEHIEQHKSKWNLEATVVICFTDGYSNFPERRPKVDQIVFVLAGGHCPKDYIPDWVDTVLTIE